MAVQNIRFYLCPELKSTNFDHLSRKYKGLSNSTIVGTTFAEMGRNCPKCRLKLHSRKSLQKHLTESCQSQQEGGASKVIEILSLYQLTYSVQFSVYSVQCAVYSEPYCPTVTPVVLSACHTVLTSYCFYVLMYSPHSLPSCRHRAASLDCLPRTPR